MAIERWLAAASLAMFVLFTLLMVQMSIFLKNPSTEIDPSSLTREFLSITAAPGLILAGTSYLMSKRYGSILCGSMILVGGLVTLVGMIYMNTIIPSIQPQYDVEEINLVPTIFIGISAAVAVVGALLFRLKPRPKRDYIFDR